MRKSEERGQRQRAAIVALTLEEGSSDNDLQQLFKKVCKILSETIGVARASVWQLSDDGIELRCLNLYEADADTHSHGTILKARDIPKYFEALKTEGRIYAEDVQYDGRTDELTEHYLNPLGITSMLDAGIVIDGELVGVICSEHIGVQRKWHSDEESFVSTLAAVVGRFMVEFERRRAEKQLKDSRAFLLAAINHSPSGIIIADANLNDTVAAMLKMLGRLIGEDIDLIWKPGEEIQSVNIDPGQIDQMLANLAVNARDAIGHSVGKVTIETDNASFDDIYCAAHPGFVKGDYVMLAVSDDGCGMDEETKEHIFEPFFTTKGVGEGTGLGLATVYGIVKQNDGFINIYSEPGTGTTFRIYLPACENTKPRKTADTNEDLSVARGQETILLVEDEPAILELTQIMLGRLGYNVLPAATPGEAIRQAQVHSGRIDLLMTDVVMPEMNGRDLAKNLIALYPDIQRLFMSGYTANVIAHQGVLDEGVHFIQKPFSTKDLAIKVRKALDGDEE